VFDPRLEGLTVPGAATPRAAPHAGRLSRVYREGSWGHAWSSWAGEPSEGSLRPALTSEVFFFLLLGLSPIYQQ
jgi:hypothetical protein